jgi:hypothetical protein
MNSAVLSAAAPKFGSEDLPIIEFATCKILCIIGNYIHRNPVERHIVDDPSEYRYCFAFPGFKLDSWSSAAEAVNLKAS